ncbi:peptidylprolyl isomerase [Agarivorans sp. 1_MG-2023]|uniref:peptidylprolyl isomerase n=1 Tax=Agarivorans sp. 1_MG-2023 TaxID=3062634 RepID=UPI0026E3E78F|nr:peptidylprolyl isomerase [Agarivorans sp. 1_MG-2023]MDO6762040.1 peptidylprolyl isomerase [Agarivorans sp. 1_MG-2023]
MNTYRLVNAAKAMALVSSLAMLGCEQSAPLVQEETASSSPIIVNVNGSAITDEMVTFQLEKLFGSAQITDLPEEVRHSVIESLISARAMSDAIIPQLTAESTKQIELKVAAYKEELLVKQYLQQHVNPTPVSTAMVSKYYQQNPQAFGAVEQLQLEQLIQPAASNEQQRKSLFEQLSRLQNEVEWSANSDSLAKLNLHYKKELVAVTSLPAELQASLNGLKVGETSPPTLVNGDVYILRMISKRQLPPKPLSEVSLEIRKSLAPIQLKKAVKEASDLAKSTALIEWTSPQEN